MPHIGDGGLLNAKTFVILEYLQNNPKIAECHKKMMKEFQKGFY